MRTKCHVYAYFLEEFIPIAPLHITNKERYIIFSMSINSTDTAGTSVEGAANSADQKLSSSAYKPCRSPLRTEDQKNR